MTSNYAQERRALMEASATVNAARTAPRPIPFPSRTHVEELCRTRANSDNARWQRQVEQRDELLAAARASAFDSGERAGYTQGWRWGVACGAVAGGLAVAGAWGAWEQLLQPWLVAAQLL